MKPLPPIENQIRREERKGETRATHRWASAFLKGKSEWRELQGVLPLLGRIYRSDAAGKASLCMCVCVANNEERLSANRVGAKHAPKFA